MTELFPESPPQVIDGVTLKFPAKLWRIVNSCRSGAISWDLDGDSIIVERKKFEDQYLKTGALFKTSNFQSFIRQLNIYGFRKIPTNGPKSQQDGATFIYKHDFFRRDHPDFLSEVVRNTAVRKTQRENAIKEVEAKHGKLEDLQIENHILNKQAQKEVDESHPLLKFPAQPVIKYGVPVEPLQKTKSKITTVYLNPRVSMCDMQRMSPTKLHHQVADILTAMTDEEDTPPFKRPRKTHSITICRPFKDKITINNAGDNNGQTNASQPFPLKVHTSLSNQILFVPNPCNKTATNKKIEKQNEHFKCLESFDQLSQEICDSQSSLMFACPVDKDDDDDELNSVFSKTLLSSGETEEIDYGGRDINFGDDDIDVFDTETFDLDSTLNSLGEEHGFLTPAYYDPDTKTVTLLLPSLNPEI